MSDPNQIVILGAGAFGTALALSCLKAGHHVTLWTRRPELAAEMLATHRNEAYLPKIELSQDLFVTADLSVVARADIVLLATPAQTTDEILEELIHLLNRTTPVVICAKGIHRNRKSLLSGIVRRMVPNPVAVLSGPSFADELARGQPTAVMIASPDWALADSLARRLRHATFRCYASQDIIGVQVAGATKNVVAIASGLIDGLNLGENSRAALLSRGLAEMARIGVILGGTHETFFGLAGMGDLVLTATSQKSRNYSFGFALGQGQSVDELLYSPHKVIEGVATTAAVIEIIRQLGLHAPLTTAINDILYNKIPIPDVVQGILSKQSEREFY
jgi:glycerol-3-phosphate dehydrogenase (NAD(P)+)